ncbi:MAG: protein-L-isoaspartate(D-aspartate) O-methyltransferase [Spirochaetes bacterium]|nr:MAG: protein-L-isoaspartate(D-aspartate) O-methyltransferase [Spirochaetota bacterium]
MYRKEADPYALARAGMVDRIACAGGFSRTVLSAMERVPRHLFVSEALRYRAYEDVSLPIGHSQTITKPTTVARMVQALDLRGNEHVLEIGTGSGYQAAVLAGLADRVTTCERIEELFARARDTLLFRLGLPNVTVVHNGDFTPPGGPYDGVIVAAVASDLPDELFDALNDGGSLVIPVRQGAGQSIRRYVKSGGKLFEDELGRARFVPLVSPAR